MSDLTVENTKNAKAIKCNHLSEFQSLQLSQQFTLVLYT